MEHAGNAAKGVWGEQSSCWGSPGPGWPCPQVPYPTNTHSICPVELAWSPPHRVTLVPPAPGDRTPRTFTDIVICKTHLKPVGTITPCSSSQGGIAPPGTTVPLVLGERQAVFRSCRHCPRSLLCLPLRTHHSVSCASPTLAPAHGCCRGRAGGQQRSGGGQCGQHPDGGMTPKCGHGGRGCPWPCGLLPVRQEEQVICPGVEDERRGFLQVLQLCRG